MDINQANDDASPELVEVLKRHCGGDARIAVFVMARNLASFADFTGHTPEKVADIVSGFIKAYARKDGAELGKIVEEFFGGDVRVFNGRQEAQALKNVH